MQTLKDKIILITRSEKQASDFITQLENLGAKTIVLPLIKTTAINQDKLIANSLDFDWIIFTSPNAVKFFFESISTKKITSKIAAVGSKTEELIKKQGLIVDFIPTQFTAQCLANGLPISGNDTLFIPRSDLAKDDIITILKSRNCNVQTLPIYKNTSVKYSKPELESIFNQKIDFITFTSGSTVTSFIELGINLNNEKVICIGPETTKIAEQHHLTIAGIASPHNIEGMVGELIKLSNASC